MKQSQVRVIFGILMIGAGVIFLLQSFGYLKDAGDIFWSLAFGVAGASFLYMFWLDRVQWWPLIPGFSLLGVGGLIAINAIAPRLGDVLGAPLLMAGISLSFWIIYYMRRENWWAIIPGGVMAALAVFLALEAIFTEGMVGFFFLGLGLTFVLVAYLPTPREQLRWALIPAAVLLIMGVIFIVAEVELFRFVGPLALVVLGVYFIARNFMSRTNPQDVLEEGSSLSEDV
jgi:hypothetical protein